MVALHIEDEEVYRLARELADRHNVSVTEIVAQTLRERLEREEERPPKRGEPGFVEYWSRQFARPDKDPNEPEWSTRHGEFLYDENGLPR